MRDMNEKEDKEFLEKFILRNPFDFKQGIIHHCRQMDKIDVYEWVANDELKIQELYKRINEVLQILDNFDAWLEPQDTLKIRKCVEILKGNNDE